MACIYTESHPIDWQINEFIIKSIGCCWTLIQFKNMQYALKRYRIVVTILNNICLSFVCAKRCKHTNNRNETKQNKTNEKKISTFESFVHRIRWSGIDAICSFETQLPFARVQLEHKQTNGIYVSQRTDLTSIFPKS